MSGAAQSQSGSLLASPFGVLGGGTPDERRTGQDNVILDAHNSGRPISRVAIVAEPSQGQTFTALNNGIFSRIQIAAACGIGGDLFLALYSLSAWPAAPLLTSRIARESLPRECVRGIMTLSFDVTQSRVRAVEGEQYMFTIHGNAGEPALQWLVGGNDYQGGTAVVTTPQPRYDFRFGIYVSTP